MKLLALVFVFLVADIYDTIAAPASTYDQQQTGDLNVQVHLKDIQIVAIMGVDDILGDYDYAYDYSDFTLKPITPHATTSAPSLTTLSSTSVKPWHTWPTITSTYPTSTISETAEQNLSSTSSVAAEQVTVNSLQFVESEVNVKPEKNASSSAVATPSSPSAEAQSTAITNESDKTPEASALPEPQATPTTETISVDEKTGPADDHSKDKEPVATIPAPEKLQVSSSSPSSEENSPSSVAPVKSEASTNQTQTQPLRRCNPGYTRDQKGRCSRVHNRRRIPASLLPFGIRLTPKIFHQRDHQSDTSEN